MMAQQKHRAFLKWAGGKYSLVDEINKHLPTKAKTLVEPFVGAGSVFLNSNFEHYFLNDINNDLINLYKQLQDDAELFIKEVRGFFTPEFNDEEQFYKLREGFNKSADTLERSVLFLYLNRHCYNGLCRYNQSGKYNVPFGRYKKPYFPEQEIRIFAEKARRATFSSSPFQESMLSAPVDAAIYCDPPYAPVSDTAYFTSYAKEGFGTEQQKELAELARQINGEQGTFVMISNHDTTLTREIYQGSKKVKLSVTRLISQKGNSRSKASELLAIYDAKK